MKNLEKNNIYIYIINFIMKINKMKLENDVFPSVELVFEDIKQSIFDFSKKQQSDEDSGIFTTINSIDFRNRVIEVEVMTADQVKVDDLVWLTAKSGRSIAGRVIQVGGASNRNRGIPVAVVLMTSFVGGGFTTTEQIQLKKGDAVVVTKIQLAKGSNIIVPARVEVTYTSKSSPIEIEENSSGIESLFNNPNDLLAGKDIVLDDNGDGNVTTMETADFVEDIKERIDAESDIDLVEVAEAIDAAGFAIREAELMPTIAMYSSETVIIPRVNAEVIGGFVDFGFTGVPLSGAARATPQIWIDIPIVAMSTAAIPALDPLAATTRMGQGLGLDREMVALYRHDGTIGTLLWNTPRPIGMLMVELKEAFQGRVSFFENIGEVWGMTGAVGMRRLKEKGDTNTKILVGCRVMMVDENSGDRWPGCEVIGIRGIRKRVKKSVCGRENEGVCRKYYRLECKNGGESTRSGKMRGRMHIECEYMKMVDLIDAFIERW
jgi:hypothetical protein